jgi:hypothetical protein
MLRAMPAAFFFMRYLYIVLFFLTAQAFGQQPYSEIRYGNLNAIGGAPSFLPIHDSSFITLTGFDLDWQKVIIRKISKKGGLIDSAALTFSNVTGSVASRWYSLEKIRDNQIIMAIDLINGHALSTSKLILFNQDLDTLKSRTLAINGYSGTYSWDLLTDSNRVVVLSNLGDTATNKVYKANLALTFLDTALNFLDTVIIEDYRPQAGGYYPQQLLRHGNHYYISGRCTYWGQFVESFLLKTDRQGNVIWEKRFAYIDTNKPTPYNSANSLMVAFNDTLFVTQVFLPERDPNIPFGKIRLLKFDTTGSILSDTVYSDEEPYLEISDLILSKDGNLIFNGHFKSYYNLGVVGIIWKVDRNFNIIFKRAYHYGHENNRSMLYRLHEWPDSTLLNVGTFMYQWQNPDPSKFTYLWLLSLNSNGCLAPGNCGVLSVVEEEPFWPEQTSALHVYPNPAKNILNLRVNGLQGLTTLTLYNLQGQQIHSQELTFNQGTATVSVPPGLATGTYLVNLKTETDAYTTKVVVW